MYSNKLYKNNYKVYFIRIVWYNIVRCNLERGAILAKFTLMNKNKKIFDFIYDEEEHIIVDFERNYPLNEDYAPFGLIKNNEINKVEFKTRRN